MTFENSLSNLLKTLHDGQVVGIHPEGGIRHKAGIFQIKRGTAYLVQKTGAPILPVAICGVEYFSPKSFLFGKRCVTVIFGKPFLVDPNKSLEEITDEIGTATDALYKSGLQQT